MHHRVLVVFVLVVGVVLAASALAQEDRDPLPLKDWSVPFEQIRAKVMETKPGLIAERALHPAPDAVPSAASHFITVVPCRLVDTRNPNGPFGGPSFTPALVRTFTIPGGPCAGIPIAAAYSLNFAIVTFDGGGGFVAAYPGGSVRPPVATVTFSRDPAFAVANAAIIPASATGAIDVYSSGNTHLILDINGYFVEGVVTNLSPGTGMTGGGTGNVLLGLAPGGVGATQLAGSAVTTGAIADNAVTANKIAAGQVVKSIKGLADVVDMTGVNGATVTTTGNTIQVSAATAPSQRSVHAVAGQPVVSAAQQSSW